MRAVKFNTLRAAFGLLLLLFGAGCGRNAEVAKREHFDRGNQFFAEQKYQEAIVEYRNAVQFDPRFGEARFKLAEAYSQVGNTGSAFPEYIRAADLLPDNVEVQIKAATLRLIASQFEDAKTIADKILVKDPKNVSALIIHAQALVGLRDLKTAITEIEDAIKVDPSQSDLFVNLGLLESRRGNKEEAEKTLKQAITLAPQASQVHTALGQFYWSTNRRPEAEKALLQAVALNADDQVAHRMLTAFYLGTGRRPEAEKHLQAVARLSKDPNSRLALADYYLLNKRGPEGTKILEAIAKEPDFAIAAKTRLASFAYSEGRRAEAHKIIDELLATQPSQPIVLLVKGRFLIAEGKVDEALVRIASAVQSNPGSIEAQYFLGELHARKGDFANASKAFSEVLRLNPRATGAELQLSRVRLALGDVTAAVTHAEQATRSAPTVPATHIALAAALLQSGDLVRAEAELKPLFGKLDVPEVNALMGRLYLLKSNPRAARPILERAFAAQSSIETLSALIAADLAEAKREAATQRIERALAKSPNQISLLMLSAKTYGATGEGAKAENALRKAIQIDPARIEAYGMLGELFVFQGRVAEGVSQFEKLLEKQPDSVPANTMLGLLLERLGRTSDAETRYRAALKIDPSAAVAANNLAWIYADSGRNLDQALQLAQAAKARFPELTEISDTLGWVYYRKQLPRLAVPLLTEAAQKEPKNPQYLYHLGMALFATGDITKGLEHLKQALTLNPKFPGADEARKRLGTTAG